MFQKCKDLIEQTEARGYVPALLNVGSMGMYMSLHMYSMHSKVFTEAYVGVYAAYTGLRRLRVSAESPAESHYNF